MEQVKLEFNANDLNIIIGHLRKGAWDVVNPVLMKMETQIREQIKPKQEEGIEEVKPE